MIPPIYKLIAKLLRANRRHKKAAKKEKGFKKLYKRLDKVEAQTIVTRKKYTHTPEYYAKRLGAVATHTQDRIKEAIALCAKSDELENRENTALADAYSLFNLLNKQIAALNDSQDAKDIKERMGLMGKRSSVAMIIRQLDPKAMIGGA